MWPFLQSDSRSQRCVQKSRSCANVQIRPCMPQRVRRRAARASEGHFRSANARLQPQRPMITRAAVGRKPMLGSQTITFRDSLRPNRSGRSSARSSMTQSTSRGSVQ